jgi:hypothetical protein
MVHQAIVGYENYVYCHECGIVKSQLSGKIINPKNGMYHFYNGTNVVGIPADKLYVYETPSSSRANGVSAKLVGLAFTLMLMMSVCLGWTMLIITFCSGSRSG